MTKAPPLVWGAILIAASLAFPTWKFGLRFLRQFFISPFQFFILPLWLIAYFSVRTGIMPARSGPSIRRDQNPKAFRLKPAMHPRVPSSRSTAQEPNRRICRRSKRDTAIQDDAKAQMVWTVYRTPAASSF